MQIQFDPYIESQLNALAAQNGVSADFYVVQAVNNYLEDVTDIARAKQVLSQNNKTYTQDEIERDLGFDFSTKN